MTNSRRPVIVITGASQGIGAALARTFARSLPGARLALVARHSGHLRRVARSCQAFGATAECFPADVTEAAAVDALAEAVQRRFPRVDVLINNAGQFRPGGLLQTTPAEFDAMLAVNLRSQFLVARAFAPGMVRRRSGDIFTMCSVAGLRGYESGIGYCAAKFGVAGLSKVMRLELARHGVRVCTVYPGATVSPSWDGSGISPQRMMPPEDVAAAFLQVYRMSRRTVVEEIVLRPLLGDI